MVGGVTERVYSLRGKSLVSAFAVQINGAYQYYECVYDGIFSFNDEKYGLEDINQSGLNAYKGSYLGETDGLKLYAFVGRERAILVDTSPLLGSEQTETLIVAVVQD